MTNPPDSDELAFLASYDAGRYPHPSVAVDVVLLTIADDVLKALLLRRTALPAKDAWTNPGGFVGMDETLDDAATRVLREKAGLDGVFIEQLYTFGDVGRDPRTRVISVTYYALVDEARLAPALSGPHASRLALATLESDPEADAVRAIGVGGVALPLAFDHGHILAVAVERIRGKLEYSPLAFELLPDKFTLLDLRRVHEVILGSPQNKDSFRRKVLDRGLVVPTGEQAIGLGHRPAALYRFARPGRTASAR